MSEHTKGKLRASTMTMAPGSWAELHAPLFNIVKIGHEVIAVVWGDDDKEEEANARRLVACWNACELSSTKDLEDFKDKIDAGIATAIDGWKCAEELIAALRLILPLAKGYAYVNRVGNNGAMVEQAETVLAKHAPKGGDDE